MMQASEENDAVIVGRGQRLGEAKAGDTDACDDAMQQLTNVEPTPKDVTQLQLTSSKHKQTDSNNNNSHDANNNDTDSLDVSGRRSSSSLSTFSVAETASHAQQHQVRNSSQIKENSVPKSLEAVAASADNQVYGPMSLFVPSAPATQVSPVQHQDTDDNDTCSQGVAFESLSFDDQQHLPPRANDENQDEHYEDSSICNKSKLRNASDDEVRGVCSLIESAIEDAEQQIDCLLNSGNRGKQLDATSTDVTQHKHATSSKSQVSTSDARCEQATVSMAPSDEDDRHDAMQVLVPFDSDDDTASTLVNASIAPCVAAKTVAQADRQPVDLLSNVFSASVRREIRRFELSESPAAAQRQSKRSASQGRSAAESTSLGGQSAAQSTSAACIEQRIADEIREFTEREQELRQRASRLAALPVAAPVSSVGAAAAAPPSGASSSLGSSGRRVNKIFRNGRTFQIEEPAPDLLMAREFIANRQRAAAAAAAAAAVDSAPGVARLGTGSDATLINMHKFVSSSGRQLLLTTLTTKTTVATSAASSNDYRKLALESRRDMAPPVAETASVSATTFSSKLHHNKSQLASSAEVANENDTNNNSSDELSASKAQDVDNDDADGNRKDRTVDQDSKATASACDEPDTALMAAPSDVRRAESRIQCELREMRTREKELREQRKFTQKLLAAQQLVELLVAQPDVASQPEPKAGNERKKNSNVAHQSDSDITDYKNRNKNDSDDDQTNTANGNDSEIDDDDDVQLYPIRDAINLFSQHQAQAPNKTANPQRHRLKSHA